jgi:peptidoglycan/xylan/chitin deacetylase (PgdA/CDA1 family)
MHILRAAGAQATFFVVGKKLDDGASYDTLPTDEWRLGAVGDHTWSHVYLPRLTDLEIRDEILRTRDALEAMTGRRVVLFRPPYGTRDPRIDTQVRWLGMLEVLWSVDSSDSTNPGPQQVLGTVVADARPGSIVLMHENRGATLSILPQLLRDLAAKGLQPVSVPELLSLDPPTEAQLTAGTCP